VIVVADAIKTARRFQDEYDLRKYNKAIVYIAIIIFSGIVNTTISEYLKNNIVQAYKIPAGSMKPTLLIGDHILVDRKPSARDPKRGDIIVFEFPEDPEKDFIKRVVAIEGDTVAIRDKQLFINGEAVKESYIVHKESPILPKGPRDNFELVKVPDSSYFVMGDNRDNSYDSRFWGFVHKSKIRGTAKSIYWSWDRTEMSVRWERIGNKIQ
jgi:signal peptidase I